MPSRLRVTVGPEAVAGFWREKLTGLCNRVGLANHSSDESAVEAEAGDDEKVTPIESGVGGASAEVDEQADAA